MASHFINNFTHPLTTSSPLLPSATLELVEKGSNSEAEARKTPTKHVLHALLASLPHSQLPSAHQIANAVTVLSELESRDNFAESDTDELALKSAVIAKVTVGLYAEALDLYLTQATHVEAEADWWRDIEQSRFNVAWYLLQTTPTRLMNVTQTIVAAIRSQNLPLSITSFTPASLARLFPTSPASPFKPSTLTTAFFPHLSKTSLAVTASLYPPRIALSSHTPFTEQIANTLSHYSARAANFINYPLSLIHQECRANRRELENIRNERAEILGQLSQMRNSLSSILTESNYEYSGTTEFLPKIQRFVEILDQKAAVDVDTNYPSPTLALAHLSNKTLPELKRTHYQMLKANGLLRPRRWILMWPKIVIFPPLALFVCKSLYASRASFRDVAKDAAETLKNFVTGWLLDPLRDVLKTVRSGSADDTGVLVRKEGVLADLDSLERMTLSLARDELHYDRDQLAALSRRVRLGDMTPVMEIYEEDIRTPLKSAVVGTLLRNVFIQVQKAKVDIDQALTGIDRLLKSQELTFAFVGVAPALAIVYLAGGAIFGVWMGGKGRSRYGRLQKRRGAWDGMRRIERLLITQPADNQQVATLPSGLLLLSLARLRSYAVDNLPANSRLREGFLEDLNDLENPDLGRDAKLDIVRRMWRCWGVQLGWEHCGEYH